MNTENLPVGARMIVRYVALGLSDEDICVQMPEYTPMQVAQLRAGATFKRALKEMQREIDEELVSKMADDPVRQYLQGKGLSAAKTLVRLAENLDDETPHSVQAKAADSILAKTGHSSSQDATAVPVLMLSPEKLAAVMADQKPDVLKDVPDCVDGHTPEGSL